MATSQQRPPGGNNWWWTTGQHQTRPATPGTQWHAGSEKTQQGGMPAGGTWYMDPATGTRYASPTRTSHVPTARAFYAQSRDDPSLTRQGIGESYLPSFMRGPAAHMTSAQVANVMADPYNIGEGIKRNTLQDINRAAMVAGARTRADTLGSGAGEGGVARGTRGNVEANRAAMMAEALRDYDEMQQRLGDERIRTIGLPYLDRYASMHRTALDAVLRNLGINEQYRAATYRPDQPSFWRGLAGDAGTALVGGATGYATDKLFPTGDQER